MMWENEEKEEKEFYILIDALGVLKLEGNISKSRLHLTEAINYRNNYFILNV